MPEPKAGFLSRYGELWREHPAAMAAVTLTWLVIGFTIAKLLTAQRTEEPPIRVKGGSLDLFLDTFSGNDYWTSDNGTWIAKKGKRKGNKVGLTMLPSSSSAGCSSLYTGNDEVTITFKDTDKDTEYKVKFNVKMHGGLQEPKMSVDSGTLGLAVDANDGRLLSNKDHGYISSIQIGTSAPCLYQETDKVIATLYDW